MDLFENLMLLIPIISVLELLTIIFSILCTIRPSTETISFPWAGTYAAFFSAYGRL